MSAMSDETDLPFDPDALREKYRLEREKRLRSDGIGQYQELTGELAAFLDDPHVDEIVPRAPVDEILDVVVIGGGFRGLCTGARLRQAGIDDIRMVETGGDFGGTWYWNQYPGVQCDIESYIYLPMLEELGYMPKLKYSFGPEIREYAGHIGRHFDLYERALFQTRVTHLDWDSGTNRWTVRTNREDRLRVRFVVVANGPLSRPKFPGIPGIQDFRGQMFHTSRWDYAYPGGDANGGLSKLADKKVGVIGTGATAIQCVPNLGEAAEHLYVFQRTPSSVDERRNRHTDPDWAARLEPGWQQARIDNFSTLISGTPVEEDMVSDGWTDIIRNLSDGRGVERITKDGVIAGGRAYALDCLIFATGFEVGTDYSRRASIEIRGASGQTLTEHWKDEVRTLHGLMTDGFPNLFLMGGMQSGVTPNFTELCNEQSQHIAYIVGNALAQPEQVVEATPEAVDEWVRTVKESAYASGDFAETCTPGYYNNEGQPGVGPGWFGGTYGGGAQAFFAILRSWRESGDLEGMERR